MLRLGVAVEKFQPEVQIGFDLKIIFAQSDKVGKVQDGIWGKIMDSKLVEIKELTEKEVAGRSEAAEKMLTEDDFFPGCR